MRRHTRQLRLCLVAALTIGAISATSAMAEGPLSPKALAKAYSVFNKCSFEVPKVDLCFTAKTEGGKTGGEYTVGAITIPLSKKITLQGGEWELPDSHEPGNAEQFAEAEGLYGYPLEPTASVVYEAKNGESFLSPPLAIPGGLANRIAPQPYWPAALKESFENAKKNHELTATETLQLAGRPWLSRENLLGEQGTAFHLPMKVVVNSPWLTTLGGGSCHVGSTEHPIEVDLTSGGSTGPAPYEYNQSHGATGELQFGDNFNEVKILHSTLVNNTFAVTTGVEGCGGSYEPYVDAALSKAAGVPSPAGANNVILTGSLYNASAARAACVLGEYPAGRLTKEQCEAEAKAEGLNL